MFENGGGGLSPVPAEHEIRVFPPSAHARVAPTIRTFSICLIDFSGRDRDNRFGFILRFVRGARL